MFDDIPNQKSQSVEDIFADTEQPSTVVPTSQASALTPPVSPPITSVVSGKRWLVLVGVGVMAVVVAGGLYWWWRQAAVEPVVPVNLPPANETATPPPTAPVVSPNPATVDTDGDGLSDGEEGNSGTDAQKPDSDDDGLFDGEEIKVYHTNPLNPDTDGDGYSDGVEVKNNYNPAGEGRLLELPSGAVNLEEINKIIQQIDRDA